MHLGETDHRDGRGVDGLASHFLLDPDVHFLNHGSFGACPRPVFQTYQAWQRELECEPVEFLGRRAPERMAAARAALAAFLGSGELDLVFVTNATIGVNIVARSLELSPGDVVLTTDQEYGACDRVWRYITGRAGAEYRRVQVETPYAEPGQVTQALADGLDDRVRVIFLSHVSSPTGVIFPVEEVVALARQAGVVTLIDGAHGPGQFDLNLAEIGADYYVGNCHKWMCAPKGAGFLYARPESQDSLEPLIVSWGWDPPATTGSRFIDEHEFMGTRDLAPFLSVPDAIEFMGKHDWSTVRETCHAMLRDAREALIGLGLPPMHDDDPALYRQMASFRLPPCDPLALVAHLYERYGVEVAAPELGSWQLLRVSAQAYNDPADFEALVDVLPRAFTDLGIAAP